MPRYYVTLFERHAWTCEVTADSAEEAKEKMLEGEYDLDCNTDYVDTLDIEPEVEEI